VLVLLRKRTDPQNNSAVGTTLSRNQGHTWVIRPAAADFLSSLALCSVSIRVNITVTFASSFEWRCDDDGVFPNMGPAGEDGNPDPDVCGIKWKLTLGRVKEGGNTSTYFNQMLRAWNATKYQSTKIGSTSLCHTTSVRLYDETQAKQSKHSPRPIQCFPVEFRSRYSADAWSWPHRAVRASQIHCAGWSIRSWKQSECAT